MISFFRRFWRSVTASNVGVPGLIVVLLFVLIVASSFAPRRFVFTPSITVRDSAGGTSADGWDVEYYIHVNGERIQPGERIRIDEDDLISGQVRITEDGAHRHEVTAADVDYVAGGRSFEIEETLRTEGTSGPRAGKTFQWTATLSFRYPWYSALLGIFGL